MNNAANVLNKASPNVPNYHLNQQNVHHSAVVKSDVKNMKAIYSGNEARNLSQNVNEKLQNLKDIVHDTKTPIILSQKARIMREQ